MTEPHYALREFALLREEYETLNLYALVDGIQFDRFFDEPLKEGKDIRSLFILPEDRILAFAGPWLLDVSKVSWIISEQPFVKLARHLESGLMVSLPSKDKGLFRFYDSRVLKILPELLSPEQFARLMKYSLRWFFLSEGEINCYQCGAGVLEHRIIGNNELGREVL